MSDVILYAAIKERDRLKAASASGAVAIDYSKPTPTGYPYQTGAGEDGEFNTCPQIVKDWVTNLTPLVCPAQTYGFKVCGNCWRCGTNCNHTICSGVSNIQVQMWGPGGGTSATCCCGGSPFGPSGAYMVTQFCVNQGETYCFCAGCAYCCWGEQTDPGICGSPTWFNSTSGINACADSGISCFCYWNEDIKSNTSTCGHRIPDPDLAGSGSCSANRCSGWNFCYDDWEDESRACHAFASRTTFKLNTGASDSRTITKYGLNGLWPAMCVSGQGSCLHGSCTISTPVFGFESCTCADAFSGSQTNSNGYGGCYRSGANGYLRIPGAGGWRSYACGGQNGCQGDSGRFGMVCVSWECN